MTARTWKDILTDMTRKKENLLLQLPEWIRGHQLATIPKGPTDPAEDDDYTAEHVNTENIEDAHIILSHDKEGIFHRPVLDIDFPVHVVASSTPGHYHLYLDKQMPWRKYAKLIDALAEAGIIEQGYASVSEGRQYTSVRLPWIKKDHSNPNSDETSR